jgi:hypothetical protein
MTGSGSRAIRSAATLHVALGLGFGIGAVIALDHRRREGELPMTPWGFRALGGGPFDDLKPEQFTVLGSALVGVCVINVVAGMWLWQGRRRGAALALATSPVALALGAGFALPLLLAGVPICVALVVAGRRSLR